MMLKTMPSNPMLQRYLLLLASLVLGGIAYFYINNHHQTNIKWKSQDFQSLPSTYSEYENAGNDRHSDYECMHSAVTCIQAISKYSGMKPRLVSFHKNVRISSRHPQTGQTFRVPNVIHLISFGKEQPFRFYNYVAYKSFEKYIRPHAIFFWADALPDQNATYWQSTVQEVPNIYFVHTRLVRKIGGKNVTFTAHASDYLRLTIINEFGGMYFDNDVIILKSWDDIRVFPLAMGRSTEVSVSNGLMAGEKSSVFVQIWLEAYNDYNPSDWIYNSVWMADKLAAVFPHLVHIEPTRFNHPTWENVRDLYWNNYNISENYAIHLYFKKQYYIPATKAALGGYDCTVGAAMRRVLYDAEALRTYSKRSKGYRLRGAIWRQEKL